MKLSKIFLIFLFFCATVLFFTNNTACAQATFIRGDINCDGVVDTLDLRLIFSSVPRVTCADRRDVNDNGIFLDLGDSTYLADYLFSSGPPPSAPFPCLWA